MRKKRKGKRNEKERRKREKKPVRTPEFENPCKALEGGQSTPLKKKKKKGKAILGKAISQ